MKSIYLLMLPTLLFAQPPRRPHAPPSPTPRRMQECLPPRLEMHRELTPTQREKLLKLQNQYRLDMQKILLNP